MRHIFLLLGLSCLIASCAAQKEAPEKETSQMGTPIQSPWNDVPDRTQEYLDEDSYQLHRI